MTKRLSCIAAAVAMTVAAMPAQAEQWWLLYQSDASTGVLDACKAASPAQEFAVLSAEGHFPRYVNLGGYLMVIITAANGEEVGSTFSHSLDACEKLARYFVDQADKYK